MRSLVFSLAMALACAAVVFAADKPGRYQGARRRRPEGHVLFRRSTWTWGAIGPPVQHGTSLLGRSRQRSRRCWYPRIDV